jgi:hypothetical protein
MKTAAQKNKFSAAQINNFAAQFTNNRNELAIG